MQRLVAHRACVCWVAKRFKPHFAECGPTTEMHDFHCFISAISTSCNQNEMMCGDRSKILIHLL